MQAYIYLFENIVIAWYYLHLPIRQYEDNQHAKIKMAIVALATSSCGSELNFGEHVSDLSVIA